MNQARWQAQNTSGGDVMNGMDLDAVLKAQPAATRLPAFSMLVLGIVESIACGVLSARQAARTFFTAENRLSVRQVLNNKCADEIMGRGVQLPDLFDALFPDEAARELREQLRAIQDLCRSLLQSTTLAA